MLRDYDEYKSDMQERIKSVIEDLNSQPVLFIGTGLSIRYFGAPSWEGLLREVSKIDAIERDYDYYDQTLDDETKIASEFADIYNEWAWDNTDSGGKDEFPPWLFDSEAPKDIYLKYSVANFLRDLTPDSISDLSERDEKEIELLNEIQPHAVITTNYDTFLEDFVFQDYEEVIGQTLVQEPFANIGEIFKIHGCVTRPAEIVLTESDYREFDSKKAYLSAKLITFFTEHPVLIVGYEPNDPNVKRILSDVNRVVSGTDRQPNIFLVDWERDVSQKGDFNQERLIEVGDGEQMVVNYIVADDFDWIFESFAHDGGIKSVNTKLLRKLLNNTYEIVRDEAPRREIRVGKLESVANDKDNMLDILGISPLDGEESFNAEGTEPATIAEAGVPVGKIISNEDVDDLDEKLQVAVECWKEYNVLFEQREAIYTFYNQRENLDLTKEHSEFLFKSSLVNIIQGSEWLIRYDGEIDELLSESIDLLDGRSIAALERNLLALGKEDILREISESELGDSGLSNADEYTDHCNKSPEERIKEYTGDVIRLGDNDYRVDSVLSGSVNANGLMDEIIDNLTENDDSDIRRALRKIELIRLANSPLSTE